jgi:hypothetical protein
MSDTAKPGYILRAEDAWRVYELIEEMNHFLHQPEHYRNTQDIDEWLQSGVYEELSTVYYDILSQWFPVDDATGRVFPPPGVTRRFPE